MHAVVENISNHEYTSSISAGNNWEDQQRIRSLATDSFQGWKVELSTNLRVFSQCPRKASTRAFALLLYIKLVGTFNKEKALVGTFFGHCGN